MPAAAAAVAQQLPRRRQGRRAEILQRSFVGLHAAKLRDKPIEERPLTLGLGRFAPRPGDIPV